MKLYYSPGACSLSCRISLHEAGIAAAFERVDLKAKVTEQGDDYLAINPKGSVPMLVLDNGASVTEVGAILDYIAELEPGLSPGGPLGRTRLIEMLSFLSSELHIAFKPFWHDGGADELAAAGEAVARRLGLIEGSMPGPFLFGASFTVADAYLFVMLRWAKGFNLPLSPRLLDYFDRVLARPTVQQALVEEGLARPAAAAASDAPVLTALSS